MNFWQDGKDIKSDLKNTPIPTVTTTKFLGVYLDNQLNWKYHTTTLLRLTKFILTSIYLGHPKTC